MLFGVDRQMLHNFNNCINPNFLILNQYKNRSTNMSVTCTESHNSELHLFSIISVSEDKLQHNFKRILARLNNHDKLMQENKNCVE